MQSVVFGTQSTFIHLLEMSNWILLISLLNIDGTACFFPILKLHDSKSWLFIFINLFEKKKKTKLFFSPVLIYVCCESSWSKASTIWRIQAAIRNVCVGEFSPLPSCTSQSDERSGGWGVSRKSWIAPSHPHSSPAGPVSASNQISAESPTKTWLKGWALRVLLALCPT